MTVPVEMVWVDLESTGLSPQEDVPLEIGVTLTDRYGTVVDSISSLVAYQGWKFFMAAAPSEVAEMHHTSGLIDDLNCVSDEGAYSLVRVDETIYKWLTEDHGLEAGTFPLCGSTINFDRAFIQTYFVRLNKFFHYRNVDVSTLKNLCKLLNPDVYDLRPEDPNKTHRVLADIAASIREYQFYLDNFLFVADKLPLSLPTS